MFKLFKNKSEREELTFEKEKENLKRSIVAEIQYKFYFVNGDIKYKTYISRLDYFGSVSKSRSHFINRFDTIKLNDKTYNTRHILKVESKVLRYGLITDDMYKTLQDEWYGFDRFWHMDIDAVLLDDPFLYEYYTKEELDELYDN